jgi:2'-5' RNA ligase
VWCCAGTYSRDVTTRRPGIHRRADPGPTYPAAVSEQLARSGLVVVVPESEPVVGRWRAELDDNAGRGAPAHVTVLFPFVPTHRLDDGVFDRVRRALVGAAPFPYRFGGTGWFGDDVVWLAPDDPRPFSDLTARVHAEFPEHPPFEGAFRDDVVPHLTVGHRRPREELAAAERAVRAAPPVTGTAREVVLLAEDRPDGGWSPRAAFPLGS